jgi:hypothetical protein
VSIEFITRDYVFSHGKPPRGRGTWAFAFTAERAAHGLSGQDVWWTPGELTYGDAKKLAAAEARARRVTQVWVLP